MSIHPKTVKTRGKLNCSTCLWENGCEEPYRPCTKWMGKKREPKKK